MNITEINRHAYDKVAPYYLNKWQNRNAMAGRVKTFASLLPTNSTVADIGAGPVNDLEPLRRLGHTVYEFDYSASMLRAGSRPGVVADARRLPITEASLDGLWCQAVLTHLDQDDVPQAVGEFHRVLKPGGICFIGVPDGEGQLAYDGSEINAPPTVRYINYFNRTDTTKLIRDAGFYVNEFSYHPSNFSGTRQWMAFFCHKT